MRKRAVPSKDAGETIEVAWNGIRLEAPGSWRPTRIGPCYLFFEDRSGPAMEVKWGPGKKGLSPEQIVKRLTASIRRDRNTRFAVIDPPGPWRKAAAPRNLTAFSWEREGFSAKGAALFCPECGTATLLQVFSFPGSNRPPDVARMLRSFQDHRHDGEVLWSLFGFRSLIPAVLPLLRHRFEPGWAELSFGRKSDAVTLHRWGPAEALLRGRDLESFVTATLVGNGLTGGTGAKRDPGIFQWEKPSDAGKPGLLRGWRPRPSLRWVRAWQDPAANRVLAVSFTGRKRPDTGLLTEICDRYAALQA